MQPIEPLNFYSLHKFLDHSSNDQIIYIWQRETSLGKKRSEIQLLDEELVESKKIPTLELFYNIFKNHAPSYVLDDILLMQVNKQSLTVGKARALYKQCILEELDFLHKLVANSPLYEQVRIVWIDKFPQLLHRKDSQDIVSDNQLTFKKFKHYLIAIYGKEKLERTCQLYHLDLQNLHEIGADLTVDIVHELTIGLNDLFFEDVEFFFDEIVNILTFFQKKQINCCMICLSNLPQRCLLGIQRELDYFQKCEEKDVYTLLEKLNTLFQNCNSLQNLSREAFNFLINVLRPSKKHQDHVFSGHKIEGVVVSQKALLQHIFIYCRWYEDQERLQLYNEIFQLQQYLPKEQVAYAYDELFAKSLVKKEMQEGMLVPAPLEDGSIGWYKVEKRVIATGKFFYLLKEAIPAFDLVDRLEYRSTSSDPATLDSLNTIIADLEPLEAPGYFCKNNAKDIELEVLLASTNKPLKVNGHSLGGTLVELSMINLVEHLLLNSDQFIQRDIELSYFDAPAISKSDALKFSDWIEANPKMAQKITLKGFISKNDFVAGAGGVHLGFSIKKELLKNFEFYLLEPTTSGAFSKPELDLHPHTQLFYFNETDVDFIEEKSSIEDYDAQEWRLPLESLRHVFGTYLSPVIKGVFYTKQFFIGSRMYESGISQVAKSLLSK